MEGGNAYEEALPSLTAEIAASPGRCASCDGHTGDGRALRSHPRAGTEPNGCEVWALNSRTLGESIETLMSSNNHRRSHATPWPVLWPR